MRPQRVGRRRVLLVVGLALILACHGGPLRAQSVSRVVEDLIRSTARVTEDVPLRDVEQVVEDMARSRAASKAVDAEIRQAEKIAGLSRAEGVIRLLRSATAKLDPSVIRGLEHADEASREAALVLARGGERIRSAIPDIAVRSRFLREGGADTVAAIGTLGQDAAREATRLDQAIRAGSMVVREGGRSGTLADFGRVMTKGGEASWTFWKTYVQPHWKVWLTSGALAAYLANPEFFQDSAGRLTEAGFQRLTELAGAATAAVIRGVGKGAGNAAKNVITAFIDTYLSGRRGLFAIVGTAAMILVSMLLFKRVRHWVTGPFRWLQGVPHSKAVDFPDMSGIGQWGESDHGRGKKR